MRRQRRERRFRRRNVQLLRYRRKVSEISIRNERCLATTEVRKDVKEDKMNKIKEEQKRLKEEIQAMNNKKKVEEQEQKAKIASLLEEQRQKYAANKKVIHFIISSNLQSIIYVMIHIIIGERSKAR